MTIDLNIKIKTTRSRRKHKKNLNDAQFIKEFLNMTQKQTEKK